MSIVVMSSSSDDDCYGNAAGKLNDIKSAWKPAPRTPSAAAGAAEHDLTTSDAQVASADSSGSGGRSPVAGRQQSSANKVKRKHKKSRRAGALELDTSATSDVSIRSGGRATRSSARQAALGGQAGAATRPARGARAQRGRPQRGRRSRVRNANNATPAAPVIQIGAFSDSEESYRPLFSKSSTQSKERDDDDDVVDLDSSGIDNSLNEKNADLEGENEEVSVKVHWRSKEYHVFKIRKFQKITSIFEFYSNLEDVAVDNLLMTLGDRVLRPTDTPASIEYNICNFIEGGVVPHSVSQIAEDSAKKYDAAQSEALAAAIETLVIKIRSKEMKNPFEVAIGKHQKLSIAMVKFAEEVEIPLSRLKFYFDGDLIDSDSTPKTLDLEGGECLDVHIAAQ